jgi:hypothetical protein
MVEFHCSEKMCQFCDALFEDSNLLIEHVKVHTRLEIRPFSCEKCESRFSKKEIWSSHKCQGKGNSPNLVCMDCKIYFQCEKTKDMHLIAHHAEHSNCPVCKCSSESMAELLEHVKTHFNPTSQLSVVCGKCMASFADDKAFYNHCCGNGFKGFQDVEVIEFSSDTEQMVACSICGKEFSSDDELEAHIKQAVGDALQIAKEKLCRSCNVKFAVRSSFEAHIIQRHLSSLQCGFCMKYFASRRAMEQHLLHHTNIHRHPRFCNACSKMYFSDGLYENHSCESTTEEEDVPKSDSPIHDPLSEEPV